MNDKTKRDSETDTKKVDWTDVPTPEPLTKSEGEARIYELARKLRVKIL